MFMFRRKRNCLTKRLWKARIKRDNEVRSKRETMCSVTTTAAISDDDDCCGGGGAPRSRHRRPGGPGRLTKEEKCDGGVGLVLGGHHDGKEGESCGGSSCCSPLSDEGLLRHAVLKRLKDQQLEMLVEAVESGGAGVSTCVLVPKSLLPEPQLLCCQIWRWPDLRSTAELRRTPACSSASDPIYTCCNPYHWSRLCEPGKC